MSQIIIKKSIQSIPLEDAHGGSGKRQLIFSSQEVQNPNFEAMTRGFLNPGFKYDWHSHQNIDELFFVTRGEGAISYKLENGQEIVKNYREGDFFYTGQNIPHIIEAKGKSPSEFYFVRLSGKK